VNPGLSVLAVIPARGGSKGISRKNLRLVAGRPLVVSAIEQALRSTLVNRVVVSTDDAEISKVALAHGAEVVVRPPAISGDTASSESALLHVLETLQANGDKKPDVLVLIQCTSPLTVSEDIDGTVSALLNEHADSALAVAPFHSYVWRRDSKGDVVGINHDTSVRQRRQDIEPQYVEAGAVYAMRTTGFAKAQHRFFGKIAMYVMARERCLEIDEPVDLDLAEALARSNQRDAQKAFLPQPVAGIVFDFDGVFTDNRVLVVQDGREAVWCNRGDGMGLATLRRSGLPLLVLSTEENPVVKARCAKLGLECLSGVADKGSALANWAAARNLDLAHLIYVGNDVNDLECLQLVGCGVAVADAHPRAKRAARMMLASNGGHGAIRELADLVISTLGK
jgi:YrbI family 3-deoxy-D-manno-octulosonate 8-phosphate phosphatase